MKQLCTRSLVSLALVGALSGTVANHVGASAKEQSSQLFHSSFRYIILSTEVRAIGAQKMRSVNVLMDSNAFSERDLIDLFALLSKRYPDPEWMDASILTSLEQVPTPEEFDKYGRVRFSGGVSYLPHREDHDSALFMRHGEGEFLRYTIHGSHDMKTIVLKGCDPATGQCAGGGSRQ